MFLKLSLGIGIIAMVPGAGSAAAQDASATPISPRVALLTQCQSMGDATERLACFDLAARAIHAAVQAGELVVIDRAQAEEASRQNFGSSVSTVDRLIPPRDGQRIDAIESTLVRASQIADGRWVFVLADGSVWNQIDTDRARIRPTAGTPVRVRRALLGSFLLTVGDSAAFRVRRQ